MLHPVGFDQRWREVLSPGSRQYWPNLAQIWQLSFYNLNMCGPLFKLLKSGFFGVITDWMLWLTWGVGPSLRNWAHATPLRFYGSYMGGNVSFSMLKAPKGLGAALWLKLQVSEKELSQFSPAPSCLYISSYLPSECRSITTKVTTPHPPPNQQLSLHPPEYLFKRDPPDNVWLMPTFANPNDGC